MKEIKIKITLSAVFTLLVTSTGQAQDWVDPNKALCEQSNRDGFSEWRAANMSVMLSPSSDVAQYPYELPIVFHVINHQRRFSTSGRINEKDINFQLIQLRNTYRRCGIEVSASEVHYWDVPAYLNNVSRSEKSNQKLGWEERCLFTPTHKSNAINVYFVQGVTDPTGGVGTSHAITKNWYEFDEPGDEKFIGSVLITDSTRGFGGEYVTVPHEVGHVLMDMGHVRGFRNIMNDDYNLLAQIVTAEQCARALVSPFIRKRE